jgi:hypothetical protein
MSGSQPKTIYSEGHTWQMVYYREDPSQPKCPQGLLACSPNPTWIQNESTIIDFRDTGESDPVWHLDIIRKLTGKDGIWLSRRYFTACK